MSKPKGEPDFILQGWNEESREGGDIGFAWINSDKSISIVLNPFVILIPDEGNTFTLVPNEKKPGLASVKEPRA